MNRIKPIICTFLAAVLFAWIVLFVSMASADEPEQRETIDDRRWYGFAGIGTVNFQRRGEGNWWQPAFPHRFDFTDSASVLGLGLRINKRLNLETRLYGLGAAKSNVEFANDEGFALFNRCQGDENRAKCIEHDGHFHAKLKTKTHAWSISALINFPVGEHTVPYLRLGHYYARHTTKGSLLVLANPPGCDNCVGQTWTFSDHAKNHNWLFGGGVVFNKRYTLDFEFFPSMGRLSTIYGGATTLTFGVRF